MLAIVSVVVALRLAAAPHSPPPVIKAFHDYPEVQLKTRVGTRKVLRPAIATTRNDPGTRPPEPRATPAPANLQAVAGVDITGPKLRVVDYRSKDIAEAPGSVSLKYSGGMYYALSAGKKIAESAKPLRVMPGSGESLALLGYTDLNWNKSVNLNRFRGSLELVLSAKTGKLWVVNQLSVEEYIAGVSEASADAPTEHLKVMADIARSYAWWHLERGGRHAGEPFHLKNSRAGNGDDQIYQGYLAETRLPRYASAARGTAGEVVTFNGQPVITPYSTRASGRTLSPSEAGWKVDWPWVVSVPDPDTAGMSRLGHGVGLSGYGSRKRAERGSSHQDILKYYFPGTGLGSVDSSRATIRIAIYSL